MDENFKSWLIREEGKLEITGYSYSRAIHKLSEHYSQYTGRPTDIHAKDLKEVEKIKNCYESDGRFSEMGHQSHGLYRAAIKAFYRYKLLHPEPLATHRKSNLKRVRIRKNKHKRKNLTQKVIAFLKSLFHQKEIQKANSFIGTKKQLKNHLTPLLHIWEKEVHAQYLKDNPRCQRCKSMEFPVVIEKGTINKSKLLKSILNQYSENKKQSFPINSLKSNFKHQVANGNRLMVLCRTCKKKEEDRKIERYPHEMPPIMRKRPPELRY